MKLFLVTFTVLLLVAITFAADASTPRPGSGPLQFDCNSLPKEITCSIAQTKRVHYDPQTKECKLLAKGQCAGNPLNQFTTISACKHKCIGAKGTTPKP